MSQPTDIAVVGGGLFLPPGSPAIPAVKKALRFSNPAWINAQRMRANGRKMPLPDQFITSCFEIPAPHPWAGGLAAPRHLDLQEIAPGIQVTHKYSNPVAEKVSIAPGVRLRSFQRKAPGLLSTYASGYVVSPTGSGKTTLCMACIAELPTKALVLVHTKDLAQQWIDRVAKTLVDGEGKPVVATIVGEGEWDDSGRVVVAMVQTLAAKSFTELYEFGLKFGLVISDEAHHLSAATFSFVMTCMPARYRLAVSATMWRHDGLDDLLFYHVPLKLLEVEIGELARDGLVMLPRIEYLRTGWSPTEGGEWTELIDEMVSDEERNRKIIAKAKQLVDSGRQVLILSERVEHCELLARMAELATGQPSAALVGKLSKKRREALLADADAGRLRIITATQLADEGLDLPGLGAVILTIPTKSVGRIQQRIGRIMRPQEGKLEPVVVDCVDDAESFWGMRRGREKLYRKLGCKVT
jgi:superfamily II DNA or RNA helicase